MYSAYSAVSSIHLAAGPIIELNAAPLSFGLGLTVAGAAAPFVASEFLLRVESFEYQFAGDDERALRTDVEISAARCVDQAAYSLESLDDFVKNNTW